MFEGLDDDDDVVPVDVGTAITAADPATAPEQPQWPANNLDTYDGFDGLGVTYVDKAPVVTDQDDEADTPHVIDETPVEDEQDDNDDGNE